MDVTQLTEQQLLELVQNSNARAKQLNNERLVAQGKLATDQQNYERSVEEYHAKYNIILDDTNLNAEKEVVKNNLFEAYQEQHALISRIENGEYEVAKPIIHPSNADKVDENGVLKEGYAPVTTARVGVAGNSQNPTVDVQAPTQPVQQAPIAQTVTSTPQPVTPAPQPVTPVPVQPVSAPEQQTSQAQAQPQDMLDLVNQQQSAVMQQVVEEEDGEEQQEETQQAQPVQPATIPNTVLPVIPTQPSGGGLNWSVPQPPTQGAPSMPAAPIGTPPVSVPQPQTNQSGVDVNNMMQGIVGNQNFNS